VEGMWQKVAAMCSLGLFLLHGDVLIADGL